MCRAPAPTPTTCIMRSSCAGPRDPSSLQLTAPDALLKMSSTRTWSEPVQRLSTPGGRLGRQPYFAVVRQPLHHVHAAPSVRKLHSSRPAPSGGISIRLFPACDGEWVCWENRRLTRGQGGCNPRAVASLQHHVSGSCQTRFGAQRCERRSLTSETAGGQRRGLERRARHGLLRAPWSSGGRRRLA